MAAHKPLPRRLFPESARKREPPEGDLRSGRDPFETQRMPEIQAGPLPTISGHRPPRTAAKRCSKLASGFGHISSFSSGGRHGQHGHDHGRVGQRLGCGPTMEGLPSRAALLHSGLMPARATQVLDRRNLGRACRQPIGRTGDDLEPLIARGTRASGRCIGARLSGTIKVIMSGGAPRGTRATRLSRWRSLRQ